MRAFLILPVFIVGYFALAMIIRQQPAPPVTPPRECPKEITIEECAELTEEEAAELLKCENVYCVNSSR